MSSKPQSIIRRVSVCVTKELRRRLLLVTADSNAHHVAIAVVHSKFQDIACRFLSSSRAEGSTEPSRCRCSSAFARPRINGLGCGSIFQILDFGLQISEW